MRLRSIRPAIGSASVRLPPPAKIADPFYVTREWQAVASAIKRQRGYRCEVCQADMSDKRRFLIADHIVERKDGGSDLDPLNVQCMCISCHNRKTSRAKASRST